MSTNTDLDFYDYAHVVLTVLEKNIPDLIDIGVNIRNVLGRLRTAPPTANTPAAPARYARVTHVIDGDTIVLSDGTRVRYIGMDAPEIKTPSGRAAPYARQAETFNRKLVQDRVVKLVYDHRQRDRYGRDLCYVYVGNKCVNIELVRAGLAKVMLQKPNLALQADLEKALGSAKRRKVGMHR